MGYGIWARVPRGRIPVLRLVSESAAPEGLEGMGKEKWEKEGRALTSGLLGKMSPPGLTTGTQLCPFPSQNLDVDPAGC